MTTEADPPKGVYDVARLNERARAGDHRRAIGGLWEPMGQLIFDYLKGAGLRPDWRTLDIGCGSLRAGVHLVDYLDPGCYFGLDPGEDLLEAGYTRELAPIGLDAKLPRSHLVTSARFEIDLLPISAPFDIAFANSVFSHLTVDDLRLCLSNLAPAMAPGAVFHATVFLCPPDVPVSEPIKHKPGGVTTYPDRDPFHHRWDSIEATVDGLPWRAAPPIDWNHPRSQKMVRFTRLDG